MNRILLIDADSTIPNIPLMKISSYHKSMGDVVKLIRVMLPFFPNKKKEVYNAPCSEYNKVYCSVIFEGNKEYIKGEGIIFGGTGVDLTTVLPEEIEKFEPDYTLYPDNDTSYGFITRGCIRKCSFCKVPIKEGMIHRVASVDSIVRHKKVKFMDNNILALPEHCSILTELRDKRIKCQFNQGLDIRLITAENSKLLSELNYMQEYIFAFDNVAMQNIIEQKLYLMNWRKDWQFKFFVYIHPDMPLKATVDRINWLKDHKCLPYIMRDITCWNSEYSKFYIDISAYCNQVHIFKKMSFYEFLNKRHSKDRIIQSSSLWNSCL